MLQRNAFMDVTVKPSMNVNQVIITYVILCKPMHIFTELSSSFGIFILDRYYQPLC